MHTNTRRLNEIDPVGRAKGAEATEATHAYTRARASNQTGETKRITAPGLRHWCLQPCVVWKALSLLRETCASPPLSDLVRNTKMACLKSLHQVMYVRQLGSVGVLT